MTEISQIQEEISRYQQQGPVLLPELPRSFSGFY
jgi:hypothetical protein